MNYKLVITLKQVRFYTDFVFMFDQLYTFLRPVPRSSVIFHYLIIVKNQHGSLNTLAIATKQKQK